MAITLNSVLHLGSESEIDEQLCTVSSQFIAIALEIGKRPPRSEQSIAARNLSNRFAHEIDRLHRLRHEGIDLLAWCTRNTFELNLLVRHALASPDHAGSFLAESAKDEQQILEGFLQFQGDQSASARAVLTARIEDIARLADKHGITLRKPPTTSALAKQVGCEEEYSSLFKFMSKYVHPSSWLVNRSQEQTDCAEYRNVFLIHAQIYALDALQRVSERYNIEITKQGQSRAV